MFADVEFSISKGTVLCSLLFLFHIKQLTTLCKLKSWLFPDDCFRYGEDSTNQDQIDMQRDLDTLNASYGPRIYLRNVIQCDIQVNNKHDWIQHFWIVYAGS